MTPTTIDSLNRSLQTTQIWLKTLAEEGHLDDERQAYSALRAVLHALRDRLTVDEGADLAAQLPLVVKGVYYDGWKPSRVPAKYDDRGGFYSRVQEEIPAGSGLDPAHATEAVLSLLADKVTAGEIRDVVVTLPKDLRDLWPESARA